MYMQRCHILEGRDETNEKHLYLTLFSFVTLWAFRIRITFYERRMYCYSNNEYADMYLIYDEANCVSARGKRLYAERYPNRISIPKLSSD